MKTDTKLTHIGRGDETLDVRPVNPTIMRASTILFKNHEAWQACRKARETQRVLSYGARGTATNFELEKLICELEGGYRAQLFPTGLASLAMVLLNYASVGAHFIITDAIYGPVRSICDNFLNKIGVDIDFIKADASDIEEKIKPNTKLILCESPGSILYEIIDLPRLCKIAHAHNIPVAIDSTYSSSYLLSPIKFGVDIVVVAATKYLSGHSDVTMGIVVINEKEWANFNKLPEIFGFTASPDDAYLVLRGIRTLGVRLKAHEKNAKEIVEFLQTRDEIKTIFYPALKSHHNHEIFMRDHNGANGMVTIEFKDGINKDEAIKFVDNLNLFSIGASWGGYESLATVTVPPRTATDWSDRGPFVRFHIGLEDSGDLIEDLKQALNKINKG
ncbi:PLP-dependent aspartate aminotransferase family protein [Campylobacter sp. RM16188]|uniref:trans-sulfuration enzyme family protein n=1 Tax=Campylobacter sp. RM16188 TaxID=1705725 RepID=UPI00155820AB|nr:PLP-dependent aspartate aminotransferase family protein [Campylobacter sp. RM16188]